MTFTSDERRERAKNFRDMISAREYGIPGKVGSFVDINDLLSELLDRRVYDSEVAIDACEALGIADLIDRPACKMTHEGEGFRCSACGTYHDMSGFDEYPWEHCPNCGAEVLDD